MKRKKNKSHIRHISLSVWQLSLLLMLTVVFGIFGYKLYRSSVQPAPLLGEFHGMVVEVPEIVMKKEISDNVLGDSNDKRIEVDLTNQKVYGFEGGTRVFDFSVSTGLWGRTPTGEFTIQRKITSQTMSGGNRAIGTYYYLPGVPWVQYFGNSQIPWSRGFSFHGTYWHNNFGHPMSHGCINMKTPDAKVLFDWAPMGTRVTIYGTTPKG